MSFPILSATRDEDAETRRRTDFPLPTACSELQGFGADVATSADVAACTAAQVS